MVLKRTQEILKKVMAKSVNETRRAEERKLIQEAVYIIEQLTEILRKIKDTDIVSAKIILKDLEKRTEKLYEDYKDKLSVLPFRTSVYEIVGVDNPKTAQALLNSSKKALEEGKIPKARNILNLLRSEVVIDTDVIPLEVLRNSLKLARSLLKRDNLVKFVESLSLLISSVERLQSILPKPILEAFYIIEELPRVHISDREMARELILAIKNRIELAKVLGYITDEKQIDSILKKIENIEKGIREEKDQTKEIEELQKEIEKSKKEIER